MTEITNDEQGIALALTLAQAAQAQGEVPVGAVLVREGEVLATGFNCPISTEDPTAHAEVVALRRGAKALGNYRLLGATLYVTLEPCLMCAGAIIHSRINRLVFGAYDLRAGAVKSVFQALDEPKLNHRVVWEGGMMADQCAGVLKRFFQARR